MANSSDVVKKVMRFKLQLSDTAESATVDKMFIFFKMEKNAQNKQITVWGERKAIVCPVSSDVSAHITIHRITAAERLVRFHNLVFIGFFYIFSLSLCSSCIIDHVCTDAD